MKSQVLHKKFRECDSHKKPLPIKEIGDKFSVWEVHDWRTDSVVWDEIG